MPTNGVSPISMPMENTKPMMNTEVANETAANGTVPIRPTISVSTNCTRAPPSCENTIGSATLRLRR